MIKYLTLTFTILLYCSSIAEAQKLALEWIDQIKGPGREYYEDIAIDHLNNIYTTGSFFNNADIDPGPDSVIWSTLGNTDIFIQKLNTDGELIWAKKLSGQWLATAIAIDVDSYGNVYITGEHTDHLDLDPGPDSLIFHSLRRDVYLLKLDPNGDMLWAKQLVGIGDKDDFVYGMVIDSNNDVYLTGVAKDTIDFDPGPNVAHLPPGSRYGGTFVLKLNSNGDFIWVRSLNGNAEARSIDVDQNNNTYITGWFSRIVDFDPGPDSLIFTSIDNTDDIFVMKFDPLGNMVWANQMGSNHIQPEEGIAITVGPDGSIYSTGYFHGIIDFDPGVDSFFLYNDSSTTTHNRDIYIQKLSPNGEFVWVKHITGPNTETPLKITSDSYGSIYIAGYMWGTLDFDPGPGVETRYSNGTEDLFILKLYSNGELAWVKQSGGPGSDKATCLAFDHDENLYVGGHFENSVDFEPNIGLNILSSDGFEDAFIQKLSACPSLIGNATINSSDPIIISGNTYYNDTSIIDTLYARALNGCDSLLLYELIIGIDDIDQSTISIFPNPSDNTVHINVPNNYLTGIELVDVSGRSLAQFPANTKQIDVSSIDNGIYFLKLLKNKQLKTIKIVVSH